MKKSIPRAPTALSAEAKGWWRRIVTEYAVSDDAGLLLLQTAMESFSRMREAQEEVKKNGITFADRYGQRRINPATTVERDSRAQMLAALKALNLDLEPLRSGPGRPPGK